MRKRAGVVVINPETEEILLIERKRIIKIFIMLFPVAAWKKMKHILKRHAENCLRNWI